MNPRFGGIRDDQHVGAVRAPMRQTDCRGQLDTMRAADYDVDALLVELGTATEEFAPVQPRTVENLAAHRSGRLRHSLPRALSFGQTFQVLPIMPHTTIEYSGNLGDQLDVADLLARIHGVLTEVGGIDLTNCKSRVVALEAYLIGDGDERHAFVHADVRFLEGRPPDVKRAIGAGILRVLQEFYRGDAERFDLQLTVEIGDIQRETYFKLPEGTFTPQ